MAACATCLAGLGIHHVGGHHVLPALQIIDDPPIDLGEVGDGRGGLHQRGARVGGRGDGAEVVHAAGGFGGHAGDFRNPGIRALARGDVGLQTHAEVGQCAIDGADSLFESHRGGALMLDLLFSLENEESRGREHANCHCAQRQPDRT